MSLDFPPPLPEDTITIKKNLEAAILEIERKKIVHLVRTEFLPILSVTVANMKDPSNIPYIRHVLTYTLECIKFHNNPDRPEAHIYYPEFLTLVFFYNVILQYSSRKYKIDDFPSVEGEPGYPPLIPPKSYRKN
jgi:hypothetical protein